MKLQGELKNKIHKLPNAFQGDRFPAICSLKGLQRNICQEPKTYTHMCLIPTYYTFVDFPFLCLVRKWINKFENILVKLAEFKSHLQVNVQIYLVK